MGYLETYRDSALFDIRYYGDSRTGTGSGDDTSAFSRAFQAMSNAGPRTLLYLPPGLYITDGFDLPGQFNLVSNFGIRGAGGRHSTLWQLKPGANKPLIQGYASSINKAAGFGSGPSTAMNNFSISDMVIDCTIGQTGGTVMAFQWYAYGYELKNIIIYGGQGGATNGGIQSDYHNIFPTDGNLEAIISNVKVLFANGSNGIGIRWYGPSDSQWDKIIVAESSSHNLHLCGANATGLQVGLSHIWFPGQGNNSVGILCESDTTFTGCESEGSDTIQLLALNNNVKWNGGSLFGGGHNGTAYQIGQSSGLTAYAEQLNQSAGLTTLVKPSGCYVDSHITNINNPNGVVNFTNEGGLGNFRGVIDVFGNTQPTYVGTPDPSSVVQIQTRDQTGIYQKVQNLGDALQFGLYDGDLSLGSAAALTAATTYYVPVVVSGSIKLTGYRVQFNPGGVGTWVGAFYQDNNGQPGAYVTGTTTGNPFATVTGVNSQNLFANAQIALSPGKYWIGIYVSSASDLIYQTALSATTMGACWSESGTPPTGAHGTLTRVTNKVKALGLVLNGWS